jgi:hypothetical protein
MKKGLGIAVAVVLGVLAASWIYRDKQPNIEQQLDTALANMPVWQIIKEQEPDFRKKVQDEMIALQKSGKNEQQIIDAIQPQILHLQMARLQNAPDPEVVKYMKINMEQTAAMQKVSDDSCFRKAYVRPMPLSENQKETGEAGKWFNRVIVCRICRQTGIAAMIEGSLRSLDYF